VAKIVRRAAIGLVTVVAALLYLWIAAVRAVPGVRRRKAESRARRRA
jgi:hypothetical protein